MELPWARIDELQMQGMQTLTSADSLDSSSLKEPRVALRLSSQRVALPGCGQAQVRAAHPAAEGVSPSLFAPFEAE